jgi:3-isopropylmalate/(R)-2-methylmalate dehydratase small subunit
MKITGKVWKFPQDDINTGLIRKQQYNHLPFEEQAKHCMEGLDPEFASKAKPGDILVAGKNFGCGSSTPAQHSIRGLGIPAIVAESYGTLFFSNCVSSGLWPLVCPGIVGLVNTGEQLEIDTDNGQVRNLANGRTLPCTPLPGLYREMVEMGGEKAYLKARLARANSA